MAWPSVSPAARAATASLPERSCHPGEAYLAFAASVLRRTARRCDRSARASELPWPLRSGNKPSHPLLDHGGGRQRPALRQRVDDLGVDVHARTQSPVLVGQVDLRPQGACPWSSAQDVRATVPVRSARAAPGSVSFTSDFSFTSSASASGTAMTIANRVEAGHPEQPVALAAGRLHEVAGAHLSPGHDAVVGARILA